MATTVTRREDVAYVGRLTDTSFIATAFRASDNDGILWTLVTNSNSNTIIISRSYLGTQLSQPDQDSTQLLYLQWNDNNSSITINTSNGERLGYLAVASDSSYLVISNEPYTFVLTTTDPSGYGAGILAGCRYTISTPSINSENININAINGSLIESGVYSGLYIDSGGSVKSTVSEFLWSFIPVTPVYLTPNDVPNVPQSINTGLALSQCIYMSEGYGTSNICNNWVGGVGFTNQDNVQSIPYYYSNNGTCGNKYTFTDYLDQSVNVGSSIGACTTNECIYSLDDNTFACRAVNPDPDPDDDDDSRILSKWWFWALVVLFVIIAITIVVIIIIASRSKQ